jgi:hypothetical protein
MKTIVKSCNPWAICSRLCHNWLALCSTQFRGRMATLRQVPEHRSSGAFSYPYLVRRSFMENIKLAPG